MVKNRSAYPLKKHSWLLLILFLLPQLAKDMHYIFEEHHHHQPHGKPGQSCLHDPSHSTHECSFCGIIYTQFFNDAPAPLASSSAPKKEALQWVYTNIFLTAPQHAIRPRGPPEA